MLLVSFDSLFLQDANNFANMLTGAAYRAIELLLGRISSLSQEGDFTTQSGNYTGTSPIYKRTGEIGGYL